MKRNESIKKLLFVLLFIFFVIVIPLVSFTLFFNRFRIKDFDEVVEINYQHDFEFQSGNVCYGNMFQCYSVSVSEEGNVNTGKLGEYDIKYIYQYEDKFIEKEQTVKVVDKEAPVLTFSDEEEFSYCPNGKTFAYAVMATDNYDGDLSSNILMEVVDGKIYFSVEDSSGNKTEVVKDGVMKTEPPVIELNGDKRIYLALNSSYEELGASATDSCDTDLTSQIEMEGSVDTSKVGEYEIIYKVKDQNENESSVSRFVYVYGNNEYNAPTGKNIYLTFDDGPGPYTEKLLDVLKKYDIKATFFVTDQNLTKNYDSVILRAYQEGHTIGLHSSTHNYNIYTNVDTYFNDLYAIQEKVKRITGYTSMIIRFPGGSSNTVSRSYDNGTRIMSQLTKAVEAKGFRYFDWNVTSGDAGETTDTNEVISNVIRSLGNNSTYVVLQHDIKSFSVDAVESIIQYGLIHGYNFLPITMDTPNVHHRILN